jgi:hypothetical protein
VLLRDLEWLELLKSMAAAALAGIACYAVARMVVVDGSRRADLVALLVISAVWLAAVALGLWITRSNLPRELRRKKAPAAPNLTAPASVVERTTGGVEP